MVINYVLIDYENVQPQFPAGLEHEHFRVLLFCGVQQKCITIDTADAIRRLGARAEYVRTSGPGHNALDFHIALYLGRLTLLDPSAYFHIISRDTGFDPLVSHLRERKIRIARRAALTDIPELKHAAAKQTEEKLTRIVAALQRRGTGKPRTCTALANTLRTLFPNQLSPEDAQQMVDVLRAKGLITVDQTKVTYRLPSGVVDALSTLPCPEAAPTG